MRASITLTIAAFLATLAPASAFAQDSATSELRVLEGFPFAVYHSAGQEERARDMAQLCLRTMEHMDDLLGFRPEVELKVLLPEDWSAHTNFPVYGMPHYTSERTLVMAAVNNAMWDSFIPPMDQILFYVKNKRCVEFFSGMRNSRHVPGAKCPRHMFMPVVHRAYPWRDALQQSPLPFERDKRSCSYPISSRRSVAVRMACRS